MLSLALTLLVHVAGNTGAVRLDERWSGSRAWLTAAAPAPTTSSPPAWAQAGEETPGWSETELPPERVEPPRKSLVELRATYARLERSLPSIGGKIAMSWVGGAMTTIGGLCAVGFAIGAVTTGLSFSGWGLIGGFLLYVVGGAAVIYLAVGIPLLVAGLNGLAQARPRYDAIQAEMKRVDREIRYHFSTVPGDSVQRGGPGTPGRLITVASF